MGLCYDCGGRKYRMVETEETCPGCNGQGTVLQANQPNNPNKAVWSPPGYVNCHRCYGRRTITDRRDRQCPTCNGTGSDGREPVILPWQNNSEQDSSPPSRTVYVAAPASAPRQAAKPKSDEEAGNVLLGWIIIGAIGWAVWHWWPWGGNGSSVVEPVSAISKDLKAGWAGAQYDPAELAVVASSKVQSTQSAKPKVGDSVTGVWIGNYTCKGRVFDLTLALKSIGARDVAGTFSFSPYRGSEGARGTFITTGSMVDNRLTLKGGQWLRNPGGFVPVDLDLTLQRAGKRKLEGRVTTPGCSTVSVTEKAG